MKPKLQNYSKQNLWVLRVLRVASLSLFLILYNQLVKAHPMMQNPSSADDVIKALDSFYVPKRVLLKQSRFSDEDEQDTSEIIPNTKGTSSSQQKKDFPLIAQTTGSDEASSSHHLNRQQSEKQKDIVHNRDENAQQPTSSRISMFPPTSSSPKTSSSTTSPTLSSSSTSNGGNPYSSMKDLFHTVDRGLSEFHSVERGFLECIRWSIYIIDFVTVKAQEIASRSTKDVILKEAYGMFHFKAIEHDLHIPELKGFHVHSEYQQQRQQDQDEKQKQSINASDTLRLIQSKFMEIMDVVKNGNEASSDSLHIGDLSSIRSNAAKVGTMTRIFARDFEDIFQDYSNHIQIVLRMVQRYIHNLVKEMDISSSHPIDVIPSTAQTGAGASSSSSERGHADALDSCTGASYTPLSPKSSLVKMTMSVSPPPTRSRSFCVGYSDYYLKSGGNSLEDEYLSNLTKQHHQSSGMPSSLFMPDRSIPKLRSFHYDTEPPLSKYSIDSPSASPSRRSRSPEHPVTASPSSSFFSKSVMTSSISTTTPTKSRATGTSSSSKPWPTHSVPITATLLSKYRRLETELTRRFNSVNQAIEECKQLNHAFLGLTKGLVTDPEPEKWLDYLKLYRSHIKVDDHFFKKHSS